MSEIELESDFEACPHVRQIPQVSQNLKICRSKIEAGAIKLEAAKLAVLKENVLENCILDVHLAQFQRNASCNVQVRCTIYLWVY